MVAVVSGQVDVMHVEIHGQPEEKHHQKRKTQGQARVKGSRPNVPHFLIGDGIGALEVDWGLSFNTPQPIHVATTKTLHVKLRKVRIRS